MSPIAKSGLFDAMIRPAPIERTTSPILTAGTYVSGIPLRGVAGQHQVAHEHFAFAGRRRIGLDEIEVAVLDRSVRTAREQPLAVGPPLTTGAFTISRGVVRGGRRRNPVERRAWPPRARSCSPRHVNSALNALCQSGRPAFYRSGPSRNWLKTKNPDFVRTDSQFLN
jgi:hypothetical protein